MNSPRLGLTAVLLYLLLPGDSFGWGKTWPGIGLEMAVKAARWKAGPFRYSASFGIFNAGYDSDIYFGQRADPAPDYTFTAGPNVVLYLPLAKGVVIDVSEAPQYVFFLQTEKERTLNNSLQAGIHFALDKLYFRAGGRAIDAKERLSTEIFYNIRRKENGLSGTAFWQIAAGSALALQYETVSFDFENLEDDGVDYQRSLERNENRLDLNAFLFQISRVRIFLGAKYGTYVFKQSTAGLKDSRSLGFFGGLEFVAPPDEETIIRSLQGSLSLGYMFFDISDASIRDFEGWVGNAGITAPVSRSLTLHGEFSKGTNFSIYSTLAYYIQTSLTAGFSYAFSKKGNLSYNFSFGSNEYQLTGKGALVFDRPFEYRNHSVRLGFRLAKNLSLGLMANYGKRDSYFSDDVFRRNFVGVDLVFGPPASGGGMTLSTPFSR